MSLIAEALKKAEAASGAPDLSPTPPPSTPLWIYRMALVGCVAVVLLGIAHVTRRSAPVNPPVEMAKAAAPITVVAAPTTVIPRASTSTEKLRNRLLGIGPRSKPQPELTLNGIMLSGDGKSMALINHQVLQTGDKIREMQVVRVSPTSVELLDSEGKTRTLQLKD